MSEEKAVSRFSTLTKYLLEGLRHIFLHNGWMKLLALLISLMLWAGLISQDESLTRDKTFQDVNVNVVGSDTMKSNGHIVVSDLTELLKGVSITAEVPQKQYENAEASAYNIRLDLSRINTTGEQEVKILSSPSSSYGKVTRINPETITVNVEEYLPRPTIPVSATLEGKIPDGWYISALTADPNLIAVGGPKSLASTISRARAFINTDDIEWVEGTLVTSAEIKLFNRSGEEVDSRLLSITNSSLAIDSVLVEATMLPTLTFDTKDMIQINGDPAEGYEVTDIRISPENITVAARQEVLDQLEELPVERNVNVNDLSETTVFQMKVQKPSEDAVISNETLTVTVVIDLVPKDE